MNSASTRRAFLTGNRAMPIARVAITDACLARHFIHCQSCADICEDQAITFQPRIGGPPLPAIVATKCTGCGECFTTCPANALIRTSEAAYD